MICWYNKGSANQSRDAANVPVNQQLICHWPLHATVGAGGTQATAYLDPRADTAGRSAFVQCLMDEDKSLGGYRGRLAAKSWDKSKEKRNPPPPPPEGRIMKKQAVVPNTAWLREGNNSWQNKVAAGGSEVHTVTGRGCRGAGSVQTMQTEFSIKGVLMTSTQQSLCM